MMMNLEPLFLDPQIMTAAVAVLGGVAAGNAGTLLAFGACKLYDEYRRWQTHQELMERRSIFAEPDRTTQHIRKWIGGGCK